MKRIVLLIACVIAWLHPFVNCVFAGDQTNLLSRRHGAKVIAFSSNYNGEMAEGAGWDVSSLVAGVSGVPAEDLPVWCTATDAPFPHFAVIELPKPTWLTTFVFNNFIVDEMAYPGISAKNIVIEVAAHPDSEFVKVAAFALERNKNNQEVRIEPQQAQRLRIIITDNWGNPAWTEIGQLSAFDDGSRPVNLASQLRTAGSVEVYGIYFDFASANLTPESDKTLAEIAAALNADASLQLIVEGHTDNIGNDSDNQRLSEARAGAVCRALASRGISDSRLQAAGYGESRPIADNDSVTGRAKNRRVTLRRK